MYSLAEKLQIEKKNASLVYRIYFAFLCSGAMSTLLGAILPSMQSEYALSYSLRGFLLSSHQIGNLSAVLLSGFLPYAIGRKKSTLVLGIGLVVGLVLMTMTGNPALLVIAFILTGAGRGTLSNITNVVVSENAGKKAAGLNVLHASFAVGAFTSPIIALLLGDTKWRFAAWIIALALALVFLLIKTSTLSNTPASKKHDGEHLFARDPGFWINTFILFCYLCAEAPLMGWLVTYFKEAGIMSVKMAQVMQSLWWIMILLGRLSCAAISTKIRNKTSLILSMGILMTISFICMVMTTNPVIVAIALLSLGFCMSGIYPTTLSTMNPAYNGSTVATGTCIATATLGGILMPMIIGFVAESKGITGGISTIAIALILMLVLMAIKAIRTRKGSI